MAGEIETGMLLKFKTGKEFSYNELRGSTPSSKFAYHLRNLVSQKIVEKQRDVYRLTDKGMELMGRIEGTTGERKEPPIVGAYVLVRGPGGKVLLKLRNAQPFLGYFGMIGGKVEFGKPPEDEARRELLEETGLKADLKLRLITNLITVNTESGRCVHHAIGFWYLGENPKGTLIRNQIEGRNAFLTPSEMLKRKRIPDLDFLVPAILEQARGVRFASIMHEMKDGKFIGMKILSDSDC
ncbi:MAG: NUDIX hydrolase [archaeon]